MEFDTRVKLAIYKQFAATGSRPTPSDLAQQIGSDRESVINACHRLRIQRVLVLEANGSAIHMAPPFSGVPTQHIVQADGVHYYANCAWDTLGILAALHKPGIVHSRCEQSGEPLHLEVDLHGPKPSDWLFHCLVPAAKWWDNIVFT